MNEKTVKITIDGKEILAREGSSILETALEAGIHIPHFCYHPGLGVDGNCRLCLVEVVGVCKPITSCTTMVKEGMVVFTVSQAVTKARKGVLEFFLLNHPLDCPFCDKGGECPLQDYTYDCGQAQSRSVFPKLKKTKHETIGEHIILDRERCVLCNRCVRFGRLLVGREELAIRNRGVNTEIFIPDAGQLSGPYTGNLTDFCPVGALTSRQYRFKARPWELNTVKTVCGDCSLGCNMEVWRKDEEVLRLTPRIAPSVNEWWLCDRGRFGFHAWAKSDRLVMPVCRGHESDALSLDQLAKFVGAEMKKVPKNAMAFVADSTLTNEEFFSLKDLAIKVGGGRVFVPVAKEVGDVVRKLRQLKLEAEFPLSLDQSTMAVVLGEAVEEDHPVLALRLRRLFHTKHLALVVVGDTESNLQDVAKGFFLDFDHVSKCFQDLESTQRGVLPLKTKGSLEDLWKFVQQENHVMFFLSDRWITSASHRSIDRWLKTLGSNSENGSAIGILLQGTNGRGMIDQWDEHVHSITELETEIQQGRVEGLFWFGGAPTSSIFHEYARGMRVFAQFVCKKEEAHPAARWLFPLDLSMEKQGTYTNTFGKVQVLRRARQIINKEFRPLHVISKIAAHFGAVDPWDETHAYQELIRSLPQYPPSLKDVVESEHTYHHYERTKCR